MILIREFVEGEHLAGIRSCLIELQDFERSLDPRRPTGAEVIDAYVSHMMKLCVKCDGRVLVAQEREAVVGFVTILTKVKSEAIEEGALEFGLVSDLVVASGFRGRGIGRELLRAAESFARSSRVRWLRVGVLAENRTADALYDSMGFKQFYMEREKSLLE